MHLKTLKSLKRPVGHYNDLLVQSKFCNGTIAACEEGLHREIPTTDKLLDFFKKRCQMWESIESKEKE